MFDRWNEWKSEELKAEIAARGRAIVDAGANDPLVLWLVACAVECADGPKQEIAKYVDPAWKKATDSDAVEASLAARITIFRALAASEFNRATASDTTEVVRLLTRAVETGEYGANEGEILVRHLFILPTVRECPDLFARLADCQKLDEVSRLTIRGFVEKEKAWISRGGGYANTVTKEGWRGFAEHLKLASESLEKAWELDPKRPQAPSEMISVTMGLDQGFAAERQWLDRSIAAQFDFEPAYDSYLWAIRPRWGGSHDAMLAFGKACMATGRYDTSVPLMYFDATLDIAGELDDPRAFFKKPEVARDLMVVSQKLIDEPARQGERVKRQEALATNAWLTGDYDLAGKTLEALGWKMGPFMDKKLSAVGSSREEMILETALRQCSSYDIFTNASVALSRGALDDAAAGFRQVMDKVPGPLKSQVEGQLRLVDVERELLKHEWVSLSLSQDLSDWIQKQGKWTVTPEGKLQTIGNGDVGLIVHRARVFKNYELTARFSVEPRDGTNACFGVASGYEPAHGEKHETWLTCETYRRIGIAQHAALHYKQWSFDSAADEHRTPLQLQQENEIYVKREGDKVTFKINGITVAENAPIPKYKNRDVAPGAMTGFVAANLGSGYVAQVWDIRVRRFADR